MKILYRVLSFPLNKKNIRIQISVIALICITLIVLVIKDGHNMWGGDFSLYVSQAKSINDGTLFELYEYNKFSMQNSSKIMGPYLYPIGYPLLISPIVYFFGLNFIALKLFTSLFLIFSIPLLYQLFNKQLSNKQILIVISLTVLNPNIIVLTDSILSDIPFLFFCLLVFFLINRSKSLFSFILLGICLFFTYSIRDIGIVLIPSLLTYQVLNKKWNFKYIITYVTFSFLYFFTKLFLPNGSENHLEMLFSNLTFNLIFSNFIYYLSLLSKILFFFNSSLLGLVVFFFLFLGINKNWKKNFHYAIFLLLYMSILLIWPSRQGIRFLVPLIPIIIYFIVLGVDCVVSNNVFLKYTSYIYISIFILTSLIVGPYKYVTKQTNEVYTKEMKEIYSYISKNLSNSIIAYKKPRTLYLFTNVKSIYESSETFSNSKADYILISKTDNKNSILERKHIHKEFDHYILLKK